MTNSAANATDRELEHILGGMKKSYCTECGAVENAVAIQECECEHRDCTHRLYSQQRIAIAAIDNLPADLLWEYHVIANNFSSLWAVKLFRESVGASLFHAKAVLEQTTAVRVPVELIDFTDNRTGLVGATLELQIVVLTDGQEGAIQRAAENALAFLGVTV